MNAAHLTGIVRMRWQLMRNRLSRGSKVNAVVSMILLIAAAMVSVGSFVFAVGWGGFLLQRMKPQYLIYVWDVLAGVFLFSWAIALMVELQQAESMSLKNLLHLPVSLSSAFLLNYASSFASLTILLFLPAMLGLCCASVTRYGVSALWSFGLLAAFLVMVTAVTHLVRGWLARLMENKRTRGTVIVVSTITFVVIAQVPQFLTTGFGIGTNKAAREMREAYHQDRDNLLKQLEAKEISQEEYDAQFEQQKGQFEIERQALRDRENAQLQKSVTTINACLPVGWLPFGATAAAQGGMLIPLLCILAMSGIGTAALALSYRTTIRAYTGEHTKTPRKGSQTQTVASTSGSIVEKSLPLLSEQESVIVLMTLRSVLRAPEGKMALLTPLIFVFVFGSMIFSGAMDKMPEALRPFVGISAVGMSLLGMIQLLVNMFGLDRQGCRAWVLMPVRRRDILFGKNLGLMPIMFSLTAVLVLFVSLVTGCRLTHLIATLLQIPIAFLICSTITNYTSIAAPIAMAPGTMKPANLKFSVMVVQFIAVLLTPLAIAPAVIALGSELLLAEFAGIQRAPVYLLLTILEVPIVWLFYRYMLKLQGEYLHDREQHILDVVSKVAD